jgi:hypothetical protein
MKAYGSGIIRAPEDDGDLVVGQLLPCCKEKNFTVARV